MGGDCVQQGKIESRRVSIHAPVWGATPPAIIATPAARFQSTPPYGGRHKSDRSFARAHVSIHAPVWGATVLVVLQHRREPVSIHAPVWGATHTGQVPFGLSLFQSTPPYGGRLQSFGDTFLAVVSIHAPVWGATCHSILCILSGFRFNPRPRMGGDSFQYLTFQKDTGFNPRPRMGGDINLTGIRTVDGVSIHAPVWGATSGTYP